MPVTHNDGAEPTYWTYRCCAIFDTSVPSGVGGVLAVGSELADDVRADHSFTEERQRVAALFEQAPTFMAMLMGPEHRIELANPSYLRLIGRRDVIGLPFAEALPDAVAQGYLSLLDAVYRSGEPYIESGAKYAMQPDPGGPVDERHVDFVLQPIRDLKGNVTGVFMQGADVTSRAVSDAALLEREEQLRLATDAAEVGLWDVNMVTDVLYWPQRVKAMFGISADVPVSMADYYNGLHPDDREHTVKSFAAAIDPAKRALYDVEYRTVGKEDGVIRWVAAKGRALFDGDRCVRVIGTAIDITHRKSAEEQLSQSELRRTFALEAGRLAAWEFEMASGKITWDARMHEFLGVPADWPPAHSNGGQDMIIPEDRARVANEFKRAVADGVAFSAQFRVRRPDGLERWFAAAAQPLRDANGVVDRFVGFTHDVTALVKNQQELEEADKRKDEFLAVLSHELRNPLAPIRTAAHALSNANLAPAQLIWAQSVIQRQVQHMAGLLDDLLDVARITQGRLVLKRESVDLTHVVDAAVEAARPLLDRKNHSLAVKLPDKPPALTADPLRLSQILSNLLNNAAKYTDPGGHIELSGHIKDGTLSLIVRDDGIGLSQDALGKIFVMFSQVDVVSGRSEGGLGIGLALVKGLTDLHGGTVEARSEGEGHGSEFIVRMPITAEISTVQSAIETDTAPPMSRRRVLVADDNRDAADSLAMLLELAGHDVRVAYTGTVALSLAETFHPDVAVLDIGMPDIDGYTIARALRNKEGGAGIRLIALTGWGQDADKERARAAGFNHHLTKPVDPVMLEALVTK